MDRQIVKRGFGVESLTKHRDLFEYRGCPSARSYIDYQKYISLLVATAMTHLRDCVFLCEFRQAQLEKYEEILSSRNFFVDDTQKNLYLLGENIAQISIHARMLNNA